MEMKGDIALFCLALFFLWTSVTGLLSSKGVNYEGETSLRELSSFQVLN
jgi:hypothetical protein